MALTDHGNDLCEAGEETPESLERTYPRLAKDLKDLDLTDNDVHAILNLYKKHEERNR